jgi:AcrR family transcriptional regulator
MSIPANQGEEMAFDTDAMVTRTRQVERSEATRAALVTAARDLFSEKGFGDTATEDIVAAAGVTRGALYHHFRDKTDLFRAVYEDIEYEMKDRLEGAMQKDDINEAVASGISAYLKECRNPVLQQIMFNDAPSVLGWEACVEIGDRHGRGVIRAGLQRAIDEGLMDPMPVDLVVQMVRGALMEAGQFVARTPNVNIEEVETTVFRFLTGLLKQPPEAQ